MTDEELTAAVETAIAASLDADYWDALADAKQTAAIAMSVSDIFARLPGFSASNASDAVVHAMAEQAVFLVRTHDEQAAGKTIVNESVDGLSLTYAAIGRDSGLSPRAAVYIAQAKREQIANGIRFTR